jgi:hypothetical protein
MAKTTVLTIQTKTYGMASGGYFRNCPILLTIQAATSRISRAGSEALCKRSCVTSRDRRCTLEPDRRRRIPAAKRAAKPAANHAAKLAYRGRIHRPAEIQSNPAGLRRVRRRSSKAQESGYPTARHIMRCITRRKPTLPRPHWYTAQVAA